MDQWGLRVLDRPHSKGSLQRGDMRDSSSIDDRAYWDHLQSCLLLQVHQRDHIGRGASMPQSGGALEPQLGCDPV